MSEQTLGKEEIKIDAIGPYGVLVGTTWYDADDAIRNGMLKGMTYSVAVSSYTSKTGKAKKRIKEVLDVPVVIEAPKITVKKSTFVPKVAAAKSDYSGRDFDAEARGKIRSLFLEAAMPTLLNGVDVSDDAAVKALMNKWVEFAMRGV